MVVAPDRTWAAVAVYPGAIDIYDTRAMTETRINVGARIPFYSGLWASPDGRLLGIVTEDREVKLWSTDNWSELPPIQPAGEGELQEIALSSTGLLAVSDDDVGRVTIWRLEDRTEIGNAIDVPDDITALAFSSGAFLSGERAISVLIAILAHS